MNFQDEIERLKSKLAMGLTHLEYGEIEDNNDNRQLIKQSNSSLSTALACIQLLEIDYTEENN